MLQKLKTHQFLFEKLVKRDFKKKYKGTVLGMAWSILSPLLMLLVMRLVFTQFFGRNTPHYTTYLFCGNLVFSFFSGTPKHLRSVYDMEWNLLPIKCTWPEGGELLSVKPKTFEKMKEFAAQLSQDFAFVRVDFFDVDGKLYMGEMTFTPMSGTGKFDPLEWDKKLGDMLTLPPKSPIPTRQFP